MGRTEIETRFLEAARRLEEHLERRMLETRQLETDLLSKLDISIERLSAGTKEDEGRWNALEKRLGDLDKRLDRLTSLLTALQKRNETLTAELKQALRR